MTHSGGIAAAIPILAYHLITDRPDIGFARVSRRQFAKQMRWLADQGFETVRIKDLLQLPPEATKSRKLIALTFDDTYTCIEDAAEMMQQHGFVGTCFVISEFIGRDNAWDYRFGLRKWRHAGESVLQQLLKSGWEIGSHSAVHSYLPALSDQALKRELTDSKRTLQQRFQVEIASISYPFGRTNKKICEMARDVGFSIGVSLGMAQKAAAQCGIMALPRIGVYSFEPLSVFAHKIHSFVQRPGRVLRYQQVISFFSNGTIIWKKLGSYGREKN